MFGGIAFVVLLFSKTTRRPALSTGMTLGWVTVLLQGHIFLAYFLSRSYSGVHFWMTVFGAGLGQFLATALVGLMSAGLTSLLPEAKRPNFIRTALLLSTIAFSLSAVVQLEQK